MNKKILTICLIAALTIAIVCFSSCKDNSVTDKLREINVALMKDYSNIELKVSTHTDQADLNAKYVISKSNGVTTISYEVERLNSFDLDGSYPDELKSLIVGTAVFNGNAITVIDGDELDEAIILDAADTSMTFRTSYFGKISVTENGISAPVTNPQAFMHDDAFEGTEMTVSVTMANSVLSKIKIDYKLDGATIALDYTFAR